MGVRRVVTGMDDDGRSTFLSDGDAFGGDAWAEVWLTDPELGLDAVVDPQFGTAVLEPPAGGTVFRVFHVPTDAQMREAMSRSTLEGIEPDGFHTTHTVDYVMVLEGEVSLELDTGEVLLQPGDCVVQRGTIHNWVNRGTEPCLVAFILISAKPVEIDGKRFAAHG